MNEKDDAKWACSSCEKCECQTFEEKNPENGNCEARKILIEIPQKLVEEIKILASGSKALYYFLFAEKLSEKIKVDGYTRILHTYDYTSYDVDEVVKLAKAGRHPILMLCVRKGRTRPTPREIMTWWINNHMLGFPLNHALLSIEKGKVEFRVYNLRECFHCDKKIEPLKNLELRF
jgi:hypothetical protein